jgi:hypothetical protein
MTKESAHDTGMTGMPLRRYVASVGLCLCTALSLAPTPTHSATPANGPGPKKEQDNLYAVLVFDTDSNVAEDLRADLAGLKYRMEDSFPGKAAKARLKVKTLQGAEVRRANILSTIANLPSTPNDTIFFFYGGHGAITADKGHALSLTNAGTVAEKYLARDEIRKALQKRNPALAVVITDCCANIKPPLKPPPTSDAAPLQVPAEPAPPPPEIAPVVRNLFLQAQGVVDINSCSPGQLAVGYAGFQGQYGGVFTRALSDLLGRKVKELDTNGDGFVAWEEFFPKLRAEADKGYKRVKEGFRDDANVRDLLKDQRSQTAWTTTLMPYLRVGLVARAEGGSVRVVSVVDGLPAQKGGLRVGDVVLEVEIRLRDSGGNEVTDRRTITTEEQLGLMLDRHDAAKGSIRIRVQRAGKEVMVEFTPAY